MADSERKNTRTWIALAGIAAFCGVAIFLCLAILVIREDARNEESPVSVPVVIGGQTVITYPIPKKMVKVVSGQESSAGDAGVATVQPTAQIGTGGQGQATPIPGAPVTAVPEQPIATVPPPPPSPTPVPPSVIFTNYTVVPGDTLYRMTQKFNTSIDLMARYDIAASSMIAGNTLLLPVANPAFCPGIRAHVVRDQQTVSEIARAYNTTPQAIGAANGLDASLSVRTSQVICVPY